MCDAVVGGAEVYYAWKKKEELYRKYGVNSMLQGFVMRLRYCCIFARLLQPQLLQKLRSSFNLLLRQCFFYI